MQQIDINRAHRLAATTSGGGVVRATLRGKIWKVVYFSSNNIYIGLACKLKLVIKSS